MRRLAALGSVLVLVACTGERVGEVASDAGGGAAGSDGGGGAAGSDGGGTAGSDAGSDAADAAPSGPEVLAEGRDCPADLRVVAGTITWVDQGSAQNSANDGVVATMPASGCGNEPGSCVVPLASGQHSPAAVEVDGLTGDVYWATVGDGSIWKLPSQGSTPEAFASGQSYPRWLAIDDVALYWTNAGGPGLQNGEVRRQYLDSGTPGGLPIVASLDSPVAITLFGQSIFFSNDGTSDFTGYVRTAELTGAGAVDIATNQSHPRGIAVNATHVFWTNTGDGAVMRAKRDGSEVKILISGRPTPSDVAVDSQGLYWVEAGTPAVFDDGRVMAARLDGTGLVTLADAQRDPRRLALDATHVYWINRGVQGLKACSQHDGQVARAPKPW